MAVAHQPVLVEELLECLDLKPDGIYVDGTLGGGSHAAALLERAGPKTILIGIDRDGEILEFAKERLNLFGGQVKMHHANYVQIEEILQREGITAVDGIYLDLGVSSLQLETKGRGFSFLREGPLDMRMDPSQGMTVLQKLKEADERQLTFVLKEYGEERYAERIAAALKEKMKGGLIQTTSDIAQIALEAYPKKARFGRIHPATRTFQALRIWVNEELENLKRFLKVIPPLLKEGGRVCILSYHSLEDRIVKRTFKEWVGRGEFGWVHKKPLRPRLEELKANPRSRSAKLRAAFKRGEE